MTDPVPAGHIVEEEEEMDQEEQPFSMILLEFLTAMKPFLDSRRTNLRRLIQKPLNEQILHLKAKCHSNCQC